MFESERTKVQVRIYRGTNFGTTIMETELIHRTPSSDEGWCTYSGSLSWWNGQKGTSISLLFGDTKEFSKFLGKGADYRNLAKFQVPQQKDLTEISCEGHIVGPCSSCWTESEPILLEKVVIRIAVHKNWRHLHLTQQKGKILGAKPTSLCLGSVEKDPQVFAALIAGILG